MNVLNRNKRYIVIIFFMIILLTNPLFVFAQSGENNRDNVLIAIAKPIIVEKGDYDGLDSFIYKYYEVYFNKIKGVGARHHRDADTLIKRNFGSNKGSIDQIYSGFIAQLSYYSDFDFIIISELYTIEGDDGLLYRQKVNVFDVDGNILIKFKITSESKRDFVLYMNKGIEVIINKIKEKHPQYKHITISEEVKKELSQNEENKDVPFAYYHIQNKSEKELEIDGPRLTHEMTSEGYSNTDISKAFMKRYIELKNYSKALSYALGAIKEKGYEAKSVSVFLDTCEELSKIGLYNSSVDILNQVIMYKELTNPFLELDIMLAMCENLVNANRHTTAESYAIASVDTSKTYGFAPYYIKAKNLYALIFSKLGEYKKALVELVEAREEVQEMGSGYYASRFFYYDAKTMLEQDQYNKAMKSVDLAHKLFEALKDHRKIIENTITKARIFQRQKDFVRAGEEIKKAMEYAIKVKDYVMISTINDTMRFIAQDFDNSDNKRAYSKSEEKEYIEIYNKHIRDIHDRTFLRSIAYFYIYTEEYENALKTVNKALEISKKTDLELYKYEDNMLLGEIYLMKKDNDKAFLSLSEALNNAEKYGFVETQFKALFKLGNTFKLRNNNEKALSTYKALAKSSFAYGMFSIAEKTYYKISLIYKELGDNDKFIEYSRLALNTGKKVGSRMLDIYNEPLKNLD